MNALFKSVWGAYCIPWSVFIPSPNQWFTEHEFLKIQYEIVCVSVCIGICVDRGSKKSVSSASSNLLKELRTTGPGTSLVLEWIRAHLPMQGTHVWSLAQEIHIAWSNEVLVLLLLSPCPLGPSSLNYWTHVLQYEALEPTACAPQQEKPLQCEAHAQQERVAPACSN